MFSEGVQATAVDARKGAEMPMCVSSVGSFD